LNLVIAVERVDASPAGQASERRLPASRLPGQKSGWRQLPTAVPIREPLERREQVERAQKAELVSTLHDALSKTGVIVVSHYSGLSVAEMTKLRVQMAQAGASFKVAKNRLVKLALEGTDAAGIAGLFTGPTAIAYSDDPIAAPKVAVTFAKTNEKLVVLGGVMGSTVLDASGIKALSDLPSLDELRAKLVGMINTPATRIASVLQAPAGQLARVMGAYASKGEAA
jgi:large subunit ribosomal protein L10